MITPVQSDDDEGQTNNNIQNTKNTTIEMTEKGIKKEVLRKKRNYHFIGLLAKKLHDNNMMIYDSVVAKAINDNFYDLYDYNGGGFPQALRYAAIRWDDKDSLVGELIRSVFVSKNKLKKDKELRKKFENCEGKNLNCSNSKIKSIVVEVLDDEEMNQYIKEYNNYLGVMN